MPLPPARSQAFVPPPARPLARAQAWPRRQAKSCASPVHRYVWAPPGPLATVEHNDKPITDTKEMTVMHQLTQLEA
jgi:hypothetical protein